MSFLFFTSTFAPTRFNSSTKFNTYSNNCYLLKNTDNYFTTYRFSWIINLFLKTSEFKNTKVEFSHARSNCNTLGNPYTYSEVKQDAPQKLWSKSSFYEAVIIFLNYQMIIRMDKLLHSLINFAEFVAASMLIIILYYIFTR